LTPGQARRLDHSDLPVGGDLAHIRKEVTSMFTIKPLFGWRDDDDDDHDDKKRHHDHGHHRGHRKHHKKKHDKDDRDKHDDW
jgi:hypothetical protein